MVNYIKAYLLQHKSVSLPGLGTIYIERIPAQSDFVNHQILPPAYHYRFDRYFDTPAKEFFSFLAAGRKIHDFEAIKLYNEWAMETRNSIPVSLEGIGTLSRNVSGEIVFESFGKPVVHNVPIAAERIIRVGPEIHKEKIAWWIYALIIAAIALVIIFFNYYRSGGSSPFGNQQKIETK